ncbi:MAG: hypothetical protein K6C36_08825 [Clostridia bacterium]|nr:hypothetical protein [Clostridia bacterium]
MKIFTVICLFFSFIGGAARYGFCPTVVFDASEPGAEVSSRASGYLYGMAQADVPDELMARSLDVSAAVQKAPHGLQHPIGDILDTAASLGEAERLIVYLQDCYPTWYYENDAIYEARRAGGYDCGEFLETSFFPKVRDAVAELKDRDFSDRLVYCPFNECDNGVWFGTWLTEEDRAVFDPAGEQAFFRGWKAVFELIRSLDPDAVIGGPGYYEYSSEKELAFLTWCRDNGCLPDVMIYHELGERSAMDWDLHVSDYRSIESSLGIGPLEVIVTEYATMAECGDPAKLFTYVRQIEQTGVYGCLAYWRLADNFNDNCADGVSPNAAWWLYRWYADMKGRLMGVSVSDLFHADFAKALKENRQLRHRYLNGFGSISSDGRRADVLVGGADYTASVRVRNLPDEMGGRVKITVESVTFEGLGTPVYSPTEVSVKTARVRAGSVSVKIGSMRSDTVYHVRIEPWDGENENRTNKNIPQRYEFEDGVLSGGAYTYESAYAHTGTGLVGGLENDGDSVTVTFEAPEKGEYELKLVYGKANDGDGAAGRISGRALVKIDGTVSELRLENTIKSEYTSAVSVYTELDKGKHSLTLSHLDGTFVLDSLLVSKRSSSDSVCFLPDETTEGESSYTVVCPADGYYSVVTASGDTVSVAGYASPPVSGRLSASGVRRLTSGSADAALYLRRGLNELVTDSQIVSIVPYVGETAGLTVLPEEMTVSGGAAVENGALGGITGLGGEAAFTVNVPEPGEYAVTVTYSSNEEGGYHAYNVDLIEQYVSVELGPPSGGSDALNVWCRSTYSHETTRTATFMAYLTAGENTFRLFNDGSVTFSDRINTAPTIYGVELHPAETAVGG